MPLWIALRTTSPESEQAMAALRSVASTVTSEVFLPAPDTLLLNVHASVALFGSVRSLRWHLRQSIVPFKPVVMASLACTAMAAWLLVQGPPVGIRRWGFAWSPRRLQQQLTRWPVAWLPAARPYQSWLEGIGCRQLAQLLALPRDQLAQRTHPRLIQALDQVVGRAPFLAQPHTLPDAFFERIELVWRAQTIDRLFHPLQRLIKVFAQWLNARQLAVSRFECRLQHHDRNRAHRPTTVMIGLSQPGWDSSLLWSLLAARLHSMTLPAVVTAIVLASHSLCQRPKSTGVLFESPATLAAHSQRTLDRLRARLGPDAVRQAQPQADWRPEHANQWPSAPLARSLSWQPPPTDPHRPAWLLEAPRALPVRQEQPWLQGPLRLQQGPYRVETGWWDDAPASRDYFIATDTQARRYWIYREQGHVSARWYLHGLFG